MADELEEREEIPNPLAELSTEAHHKLDPHAFRTGNARRVLKTEEATEIRGAIANMPDRIKVKLYSLFAKLQ